MALRSNPTLNSYVKTTVACLALALMALLLAVLGAYWLPQVVGSFVAAVGLLVASGAALCASAGAIVVIRYRRGVLAERDLFLELNRSREPDAIAAAVAARFTGARRWLARRVLGHDFLVGDWVETKSWAEIRATLDERGCLEQLPFMPEMLAMCGKRARVLRSVHRLFDYRKTRRMRHMVGAVSLVGTVCAGSSHGGCEAACHTIWKAAWLRRVEPRAETADSLASPGPAGDTAVLQFGTQAPRYLCQLTQLSLASQPVAGWSVVNFLRPVIAGNVSPAAFVVGSMTYLFNEIQRLRQGVGFPVFEPPVRNNEGRDDVRLSVGEKVVVRPSGEIRATLNDASLHRGLYFEPDMLKHCGHRYRVQAEIKKLIDIVTGEIRTMKTPAYILSDMRFSGERQLFNAQLEPLFWRAAWLQRDGDSDE